MGYSIRTDRYRYNEWLWMNNELGGVELYDHGNDDGETVNVASRKENRKLCEQLSSKMHADLHIPPVTKIGEQALDFTQKDSSC